MSTPIPRTTLADPLRLGALTVFPLFTDAPEAPEYRLSEDAIVDETVKVEEVSEGGSVPDLYVTNDGEWPVLFLEGEELIGAKQNRMVNTSLLVAAKSRTKIPVSCVEQGRWGYRTRRFSSGNTQSPSKLRKSIKSSVTSALAAGVGPRSDQAKVWAEVEEFHGKAGYRSPSSALSDLYREHEKNLEAWTRDLPYRDGAKGIAIAIGPQLVSCDLFDRAETCARVWPRLVRGSVFDAMLEERDEELTTEAAEAILAAGRDLDYTPAKTVGIGCELRAEGRDGLQASALLHEDTMVHGSILP